MATTFSILPRVSIDRLPVLNVKTRQVEIIAVNELFQGVLDFTHTATPEYPFVNALNDFISEAIYDLLEIGKTGRGLNDMLGLSESPPRFVAIEDVEEWIEQNKGNNIQAKYFITKVDYGTHSVDNRRNRPISELGLSRIFLSAPLKIRYNKCEFFEPDKSNLLYTTWEGKKVPASCGFQYFYQAWGNQSNYSKFFGSTKLNGRDVVQKIKDWAKVDPPQFDDWCSYYKGHQFVKNQNLSKLKPVPEWIDLDSITTKIPEVEVVDFTPTKYTSEEEYNSLTLLDIVKLCQHARLNLIMTDDLDQQYLSYIDNDFTHPKGKRKKKGSVVVKIIDNHGYFVMDGNVKLSAVNRSIRHSGMYEGGTAPNSDINKSGCNQVATDYSEPEIIKHPLAKFKHGDLQYNWENVDWEMAHNEDAKREICSEWRKGKIMKACSKEAPPTPEQLVEFTKKDTPTILYVGNSQLNGFVDWFMRYKGIKPDNCRGLAHTIHKATYGNLKVLAYHQHPNTRYTYSEEFDGKYAEPGHEVGQDGKFKPRDEDEKEYFEKEIQPMLDAEKDCWKWWKDTYKELAELPIPSPAVMANAVYDGLYQDREFNSRFNIYLRDIFYNSEIKPDFRLEKPSDTDSRHGFSLDFSKAYTKAMELMDCEWSVFDAIDQPKKFKTFNENNFYLCSEEGTSYPFKGKGGLVLYHGCLLRHLLGCGVKPEYEIASHKKLPNDYFAPFTKKCYEIAGDGKNNLVSGKTLVNNFIGTLKRKDGISDYRLTINQDKMKSQQNLLDGYIVSNLNDNSKFRWRGNTYLTALATKKFHYCSGQPIRLQIVDRINELNLLLYRAYKQSLKPYPNLYEPHLAMVKTDALYFEYPCKTWNGSWGENYYWRNWDFDPEQVLDEINKSLPEGYEVQVERIAIGMSRRSDYLDFKWENHTPEEDGYRLDGFDTPEPDQRQRPVKLSRNKWKSIWNITHKWKVSGCPAIIKSICVAGGAVIEGEAGTGKTEILKELDTITAVNKKLYRWVRLFYKLTQPKHYYQLCEDWRNLNPVYVRKFAPTNKACNNIKGKTLHKGLGLKIKVEEEDLVEGEEVEEQEVDFMERIVAIMEGDGRSKDAVDILVVDEISMMGGEMWSALNYIKLRIPTIKFILGGDIERQLPPVKEEGRQFYHARVLKELTNHNKIILHYNFRRKGDRNELWEDWSLHPEKFIPEIDPPILKRNLCFTNHKRKEIIDLVQKSLPYSARLKCMNPNDYNSDKGQQTYLNIDLGTPLIARKSIADLEVAKNEIWNIKTINKQKKFINLEFEGKDDIEITFQECVKWFLSAYCITIHKSQGDTYKDRYVIHEWKTMSGKGKFLRKLRYVAQSRSINPKELISYTN
tara:strand:- start:90 stop:4181 length:4092 start_codon:yes stop_codon:yes gene_type:complete